MQRAAHKTTALIATAAAVGFSSLFLLASPASAAPTACTNGATLLAGNVCELRLTTVGSSSFTPSAEMSQLEVLLVAGGGNGSDSQQGYGGGGGGEVKVVGFGSDTTTPLTLVVGGSGLPSTATQGATEAEAFPGMYGGTSGNGNSGLGGSNDSGGGAVANPTDPYNGGAGATVASIAPSGSLFSTDTSCYGGGGASGSHLGIIGTATCGGGYVVDGPTDVVPVAPMPNSGGGGAGGGLPADSALRTGASGLVVLRWVPLDVTVSFAGNGHGESVAPQTFVAGGIATRPADPTADGFVFNDWYTDAALTTRADFSAPVTASTTFYASWSAVAAETVVAELAKTGRAIDPSTVPVGLAALGLGLALVALGARRARKAN